RRLEGRERRRELRSRVAGATATIGLIAEAVGTGFIDRRLVTDLRMLAHAVPDRGDLIDGPLLGSLDIPHVSNARREELVARLGGFGIATGADLLAIEHSDD